VARKGAKVLHETAGEAALRGGSSPARPTGARPERHDEVWILDEEVRNLGRRPPGGQSPDPAPGPGRPSARGATPAPRPKEAGLPAEIVNELAAAVGRDQAAKLGDRMAAAARAYERDRYAEAFRLTRGLVEQVPESSAARELHGLVCYRIGRWTQAITHLEAARALGGDDMSQLPVLMDCHRALHRHRRVAALWEELRASSPSPDLLVEGRVVLASDLADQRKLGAAVEVLASAGAARNLRHPGERHIRQWYVLADLYERAGDVPHARELFGRVAAADPELADAAERFVALGRSSRRPRAVRVPASPTRPGSGAKVRPAARGATGSGR
jgi:tetratricopeptide (TPR) repeat protein